jgi:hypothetical protein
MSMLREVHTVYVRTSGKAKDIGDRRLRRQARRLERRRERLDQLGLARLRALLDELRARQVPV